MTEKLGFENKKIPQKDNFNLKLGELRIYKILILKMVAKIKQTNMNLQN